MKVGKIPLWIFILPASLITLTPDLRAALLYDRANLLNGEWWRLWTGHWVHFSSSHFWWNTGALILTGTWLERLRPGWLLRYTLVAAPGISLGLLWFQPAMMRFGGLSGLATGVVVLLGLALRKEGARDRWMGTALLTLVALKMGRELLTPGALFSDFADLSIQPALLAHAIGAFVAALFVVASWGKTPPSRDGFPVAPRRVCRRL